MRLRTLNLGFAVYYFVSALLTKRHRIEEKGNLNTAGKLIVSLTTKPDRVMKTWLVLESILRQKRKPDALILYLAREEFRDEEMLPKKVLSLKRRGLQIVFVEENLKPHNKYFNAMSSFPKADIITVDDDKIYPPNLVGALEKGRKAYPGQICAVMTRKIEVSGWKIREYVKWKIEARNEGPSHGLISLGVCGVLYPAGCLHQDAFDIERLKSKALFADDLWIKIMALKNNVQVVSIAGHFNRPFVSLTGLGGTQLMKKNIGQGDNDRVFKALIRNYRIDISRFKD